MNKQLSTTAKAEQVSAQVVIASIEKKASKHLSKLASIEIKTKEHYENAAIALKELKAAKKEAETQEAVFIVPLNKLLKDVKALFKPFYTKVDTTEQLTKAAMLKFLADQDVKIKKLEAKLESGEIKKVSTFMQKAATLTPVTGAASQRTTREVIVEDEKLVPREYMMPDMAKIKAAYKEGKTVKGCKVEERKGLSI